MTTATAPTQMVEITKVKHEARQVAVKLWQSPGGEWLVRIGKGEHAMPATDVEVSLWLALQEAKR